MFKQNEYVERYKDLYPFSFRSVIRSSALYGLASLGYLTGKTKRSLSIPRVHILLFHYVFPDEEDSLRKTIESLLKSNQTFISYSDAINKVVNGNIDKPYLSITFDDGYHNCLRAGEIFAEYNISALFYLNSSMIGETNWTRINTFCRERIQKPPIRFLSWSDVDSLINLGHEIGGHTRNHLDLSTLTGKLLQQEIVDDKNMLESHIGSVKHFAWPYGTMKQFSIEAKTAVFASGYQTCASGLRGAHTKQSADFQFCVRRGRVVAAWPVSHTKYLLSKSAEKASVNDNKWSWLE